MLLHSQLFAPSGSRTADDQTRVRVLVVDDTEAQRYAVVRAMRLEGFDVLEACSGEEALAVAQTAALDAVILDVHLPVMDGFEVCRRIKSQVSALLPVLHVSSRDRSDRARAKGLAAGADGYLTHPFEPDDLRAAVSALVSLKRQKEARAAASAFSSLLQDSLDALSDHIALLDANGAVVAVNRAWAEFARANDYAAGGTGLGSNYCDVCIAAAHAGVVEAETLATRLRALLRGESESVELEYPCHSPTEQRWFRVAARRIEGFGPIRAIVSHINQTSEKVATHSAAHAHEQAEIANRAHLQSEARFRRFVESTHEGVVALDTSGLITYSNSPAVRMLGADAASAVGLSLFDFLTTDSAFHTRTRFASWQRGLADRLELKMRQADGTVVDVLASISPIAGDRGELTGVLALLSDVTAQKHASEGMARALSDADHNRRRLEATLDAIPVGVWMADASGAITSTNPAADRIWGTDAPRPDADAYDVYRCFDPDTGQPLKSVDMPLARLLLTGEPVIAEGMDIVRFDGVPGHILVSAAPITAADGELLGAVVVNVDLSEQRVHAREREHLVQALETERANLAAVFDNAPSFMAVLRGPEFRFEHFNSEYQRVMLGRADVGEPFAEVLPELCEQGALEQLRHVRQTGETIVLPQLQIDWPSDDEFDLDAPPVRRFVNVVYQRLTAPDGDHAVIVNGVDITDQVRVAEKLILSKARLREQFEKLPVPTFLWEACADGDFTLLECNDAAQTGTLAVPEGAQGQSLRSLFSGHDDVREDLRRCLAENVVIRRTIEHVGGEPQRVLTLDLTMGPQQPDRVLVHAVDVTEKLELEMQLRQAQKMDAVGRLAGGVAHDFNNLLTVIGAHSSFLLESLHSSDPQREDAQAIHAATVRAAGLTRQLLAFSRKQLLKPELLDLNARVEDTRGMLTRLLGEDIEIHTALHAALQKVVADPGQIDQVIVNLAVNARDAMPNGGRITLSTAPVSIGAHDRSAIVPAGDYALLTVRDTGLGMAPEVQARLFEPFFTTKGPGKGTGLGLATVYGIVKQSGGYILVDTVPGGGTTFSIYLPAVSNGDPEERVQEASRLAARGVETVLLVEDDPAVREVAKRVLRRLGYVVLEAASGNAALQISATYDAPIHLLLTDAVMPGMGGAEVTRRLQEQRPGMKALLMSGYTDDEIVRRGIISATIPFVQKPFTAAELGRAVRDALERRKQEPG